MYFTSSLKQALLLWKRLKLCLCSKAEMACLKWSNPRHGPRILTLYRTGEQMLEGHDCTLSGKHREKWGKGTFNKSVL